LCDFFSTQLTRSGDEVLEAFLCGYGFRVRLSCRGFRRSRLGFLAVRYARLFISIGYRRFSRLTSTSRLLMFSCRRFGCEPICFCFFSCFPTGFRDSLGGIFNGIFRDRCDYDFILCAAFCRPTPKECERSHISC
jgi:hypothetical protein